MQRNIHGGGAQTVINGLRFENNTRLDDALLNVPGYEIFEHDVYFNGEFVAKLGKGHDLYRNFLTPKGIDYKTILSRKLLPDEAIYVPRITTMFIIEKKFQASEGSVDEKLQTSGFKKRQYTRLFKDLGYRVEYVYVLNDFFQHPKYRDVLDYISEVNSHYFFEEIPLRFLGLPFED